MLPLKVYKNIATWWLLTLQPTKEINKVMIQHAKLCTSLQLCFYLFPTHKPKLYRPSKRWSNTIVTLIEMNILNELMVLITCTLKWNGDWWANGKCNFMIKKICNKLVRLKIDKLEYFEKRFTPGIRYIMLN